MNLLLLVATITTLVVGKPVPVVCASPLDAQGIEHAGQWDSSEYPKAIMLSPITCSFLSESRVTYQRAKALYVLVHESQHAAGIPGGPDGEHLADCVTLELFPALLAKAHLPAALARFGQRIHDSWPAPYSGAC